MNREQLIERLWEEYNHAYESLKQYDVPTASYYRWTGHAQCALSVLAVAGEDTSNQHRDMAKIFARDIGVDIT